jgi:DNA-binding beta-propeller fold protein YncE
MRRSSLAIAALASAVAALALAPLAARGDGLPIPGVNAKPGGIATRDGTVHYVTGSRRGKTVVARIDWTTGKTTAWTRLAGAFSIPAVGLDGSPSGLSANGRVLAMIQPRRTFPQASTHLVLLDARRLEVRQRIDLKGDFSFDAISPDGNRLYLIQYLSRHDPTHYAVRAYDVAAGRLDPQPIVDPTEPDEQMRGYPVTREASPDGRWQYTLYSGTKMPFVHALDTARGRARCIDLPRMPGSVYRDALRINPDGSTLAVTNRSKAALATVDTATFKASKASSSGAGRAQGAGEGAAGGAGSAFPWLLLALGGGLIVGAASLWGMPKLHRRRLAGTDD